MKKHAISNDIMLEIDEFSREIDGIKWLHANYKQCQLISSDCMPQIWAISNDIVPDMSNIKWYRSRNQQYQMISFQIWVISNDIVPDMSNINWYQVIAC